MKQTKILLTLSTILALSSTLEASDKAKELFMAKCSACHSTTRPTDMKNVVAPALMGVMRHLKMEYPKKSEAVAFIKDYVLNPSLKKAICMPKKIERFGLMPSQKGSVSKKELDVIGAWMFDNFPPKDFRGHGNRRNRDR